MAMPFYKRAGRMRAVEGRTGLIAEMQCPCLRASFPTSAMPYSSMICSSLDKEGIIA